MTLFDISARAQQVNNLYLPEKVAAVTEEQEECFRSLRFNSPFKKQKGERAGKGVGRRKRYQ